METKHQKKVLKKILPELGCAKGFVNGPCGSFVDGKCEVDHTKDCAWVLVFRKLRDSDDCEKFVDQYVEPKR
ncbi:MAG: methylenetetrahydrofolate reductase C-terminal domain-containing protein [Endomicrobium sp.]|nr:methylenetetrahydrofolate reductase C-terminal domain-containing protein [Endomicrobium sp.]